MELGWGGFDRAKLDMLILIRVPFSIKKLGGIICAVHSKGHSLWAVKKF